MVVSNYGESVKVISVAWTSDAAGAVTESFHLDGELIRVVTNPDDVAAPTTLYDITLVDEDGFDIAGGELANRSATVTESVTLAAPSTHYGPVTFTVAAAGDTKQGTAKLYYR
jgi:hypothetical protein